MCQAPGICMFATEIKWLTFDKGLHILPWYNPPICIWIQLSFNGWLIEFGTLLVPDNRPCFYKHISRLNN